MATALWDKLNIEDRLPEIEKMYVDGLIDKDVAHNLGVSKRTFEQWKKDKPALLALLKKGKQVSDQIIENALYQRAKGYSHPDTHISNYQGEITITDITKHYPPDTAAAFIWLKNRQGWRDKQEHEYSGEINLKELTDDEIERRIKASLYDTINTKSNSKGKEKSGNNERPDVKRDIQEDVSK